MSDDNNNNTAEVLLDIDDPFSDEGEQQGSHDETATNHNPTRRSGCTHPVATFFHIFFKAAAVLCYLILPWFFDNIIVFIICVLMLAFDFWTVKNITGRLLVGLRWWNEVTEDGNNIWHFEAKQDHKNIDIIDSQLFWIPVLSQPLVWLLLTITAFLNWHFDWLIVIFIALILSCTNLWGYVKCKSDARKRVTEFIARQYLNSLTN